MRKKKDTCLNLLVGLTVSAVCILILYIVKVESNLLSADNKSQGTKSSSKEVQTEGSKFGRPSLVFSKAQIHENYIDHSQLINKKLYYKSKNGKKQLCIRPYYTGFFNVGDRKQVSTVVGRSAEWIGTTCSDFDNVNDFNITKENNLTFKQSQPLTSKGSLQFSDGSPILETTYKIDITLDNQKLSRHLTEESNLNNTNDCKVNVDYRASNIYGRNQSCLDEQFKYNAIKLYKNQNANAHAVVKIKNGKMYLTLNDASEWTLQNVDLDQEKTENAERSILIDCPEVDLYGDVNVKYFQGKFKYRKSGKQLNLACKKVIKRVSTETEKLSALYNIFGSKNNLKTTLDKALTEKLEQLTTEYTKNRCNNNDCDIGIQVIAMETSTGKVKAIVNQTNGSGSLLDSNNQISNVGDLDLTSMKLQTHGSVVKPIFSKAILEQTKGIGNLKIGGISAGTISKNQMKNHTRQIFDSPLCPVDEEQSIKSCKKAFNNYSMWNKSNVTNVDFNKFIKKSNNVYAASMMLLANSAPQKKTQDNDNNEKQKMDSNNKFTKKLISKHELLRENAPYFGLPGASLHSQSIAPWADYMNTEMEVRFSNAKDRDEFDNTYSPYRDYIWSDAPLGKEFKRRASPEREYYNYSECVDSGFFGCDAHTWIIGTANSRWNGITIAEQISRIASDKKIRASLVNRSQSQPKTEDSEVNSKIFKAMKGVVESGGTAYELPDTIGINNTTLAVIAKTGTPNRIKISRQADLDSSNLIADYMGNVNVDYTKLVSKQLAQENAVVTYDLSETGKELLKKMSASRSFVSECKSKCKKELENNFLIFLQNKLNISQRQNPTNEGDNKRLVFAVGKENNSGNKFESGCTFFIAIDKPNVKEHIAMASRILKDSDAIRLCIEIKIKK